MESYRKKQLRNFWKKVCFSFIKNDKSIEDEGKNENFKKKNASDYYHCIENLKKSMV